MIYVTYKEMLCIVIIARNTAIQKITITTRARDLLFDLFSTYISIVHAGEHDSY